MLLLLWLLLLLVVALLGVSPRNRLTCVDHELELDGRAWLVGRDRRRPVRRPALASEAPPVPDPASDGTNAAASAKSSEGGASTVAPYEAPATRTACSAAAAKWDR